MTDYILPGDRVPREPRRLLRVLVTVLLMLAAFSVGYLWEAIR